MLVIIKDNFRVIILQNLQKFVVRLGSLDLHMYKERR